MMHPFSRARPLAASITSAERPREESTPLVRTSRITSYNVCYTKLLRFERRRKHPFFIEEGNLRTALVSFATGVRIAALFGYLALGSAYFSGVV